MDELEKKRDAEVLFPEQEIYGEKLRPWSYDQFVSVMPVFKAASDMIKQKGINFETIEKLWSERDIPGLIGILLEAMPFIPEIMLRGNGIEKEKSGSWDFDKTISIFLLILIQNAGRVKNFSGLGSQAKKLMMMAG